VEDRRIAAEKAALSLKVKNDSLTRQLELEKQKMQEVKVVIGKLHFCYLEKMRFALYVYVYFLMLSVFPDGLSWI